MSRQPYDTESLGSPQPEVAARLKAFRVGRGLSLRAFSKGLQAKGHQISHTAVMKYETGALKITDGYLEMVREAYNVPFGWFLSGLEAIQGAEHPVLEGSGLEELPSFLHASMSRRLEEMADGCELPDGPGRPIFYRMVGDLILAPFSQDGTFVRAWTELSEREISTYISAQLGLLEPLLRKVSEEEGNGEGETESIEPLGRAG
jgi:transcriptional regulator with XRE-family HTH domain